MTWVSSVGLPAQSQRRALGDENDPTHQYQSKQQTSLQKAYRFEALAIAAGTRQSDQIR